MISLQYTLSCLWYVSPHFVFFVCSTLALWATTEKKTKEEVKKSPLARSSTREKVVGGKARERGGVGQTQRRKAVTHQVAPLLPVSARPLPPSSLLPPFVSLSPSLRQKFFRTSSFSLPHRFLAPSHPCSFACSLCADFPPCRSEVLHYCFACLFVFFFCLVYVYSFFYKCWSVLLCLSHFPQSCGGKKISCLVPRLHYGLAAEGVSPLTFDKKVEYAVRYSSCSALLITM